MSKPWLKSWTCSLDKRKVMSLPGDLFKVWQVLQWVAARYDEDGLLPSLDDCAFTMRKDEEWIAPLVAQLVERGLIDKVDDQYRMHDWEEWQTRKPSDEPDAVLARVRKHRGKTDGDVTPRNALQDVTENVTPRNARNAVKTRSDERREEEKNTPPVSLRSTSPRGARIPAQWPVAADLDEMDAYGESLGIRADDVASHISEFHDYWQQATKNATSLDWVKRWRSRFAQDVRDGKIGARASPNGHPRPERFPTKMEQIGINNAKAEAEFDAMLNGSKPHGAGAFQGTDEPPRRRLPS